MNNALVRFLRLRCFKICLKFDLGGLGQRENVYFSAFAMQPNRSLMKVNVTLIQFNDLSR